MARFTIPRDIYYGNDSIKQLAKLKGQRAFIVIGGHAMKRFGFLDRVREHLHAAGMKTAVFEDVEPDPSVETVLRGAAAMREYAPDWIVGLGGGSPIDAAKAMWVFYEYPDTDFEALTVPFAFPTLRQKARFIAIPSTSGTATEVTAFSVITDYEKGIKYPLADFNITPDIAIVDPSLAETMPKALVANTGMDALTHAVEAYVSTANSVFTDPLALQAIKLILWNLPASYDGSKDAREQMHYAQCLAGMAFSNALLGIVHSLAHKTGAAFSTGHVPHGLANAMYLPYVIRYNRKAAYALRRYGEIGRFVGWEGSDDALTDRLIGTIEQLGDSFGIPRSLQAFGVEESEFLKKSSRIATLAVEDACTGSNPRSVTPDQMERLLSSIYYGTPVDF